jgi:hypothetical protein
MTPASPYGLAYPWLLYVRCFSFYHLSYNQTNKYGRKPAAQCNKSCTQLIHTIVWEGNSWKRLSLRHLNKSVLAPWPLLCCNETENVRTMAENSDAIFFLLPMNKVSTTNTRTKFRLCGYGRYCVSYKSVVSFFSGKFGTFTQYNYSAVFTHFFPPFAAVVHTTVQQSHEISHQMNANVSSCLRTQWVTQGHRLFM